MTWWHRANSDMVKAPTGGRDAGPPRYWRSKLLRAAFVLSMSLLLVTASQAQRLVDPSKVPPEYREAAEKRRAEQLKQLDCGKKADHEHVLPRDRTVFLAHCLEEPASK